MNLAYNKHLKKTAALIIIIIGGLILFYRMSATNSPTSSSQFQLSFSENPTEFLSEAEKKRIAEHVSKKRHPNVYMDDTQIQRQKQKAAHQPWRSYYAKAMAAADQALKLDGCTITKNGGPSNGHIYKTDCPYCGWKKVDPSLPDHRDGKINPLADRKDYAEAVTVSAAVSNLGLAWQFTQESRYARKAVDLINEWCLNTDSRMAPVIEGAQSYIELFVSLPGLFYGADLVMDYKGWDTDEKTEFKRWVKLMALQAIEFGKSNNMQNWKINFIAASGALLDDAPLLYYAFGRFKELIRFQMDDMGRIKTELNRTKSLFYSLFALNAMMSTAEIARHFGVDLYHFEDKEGKGLILALKYHAPFAQKDNGYNWPFAQIVPLSSKDNVALYELAWSQWKDTAFRDVILSWGRPMSDNRIHRQITLTHGSNLSE